MNSNNWSVIVVSTGVFTILSLFGARAHPLWSDEAQTALFARNILRFGVPTGWDGVNTVGTLQFGTLLDERLVNNTSPWLQFYLTAISFRLLGESSLAARLPFVAIGALTIPLTALLAYRLTKQSFVAVSTAILLASSTQYILYSFQARYYIVTAAAALLVCHALLSLRDKRRFAGAFFIGSVAVGLFVNHVTFPLFVAAALSGFGMMLFMEKTPRVMLVRFIAVALGLSLVAGALVAPWFVMLKPFSGHHGVIFPSLLAWMEALPELVRTFVEPFLASGVFPLGFVPFVVISLWQVKHHRSSRLPLVSLVVILATYAALVVLLASVTAQGNTGVLLTENRYHALLIPFLTIGVAAAVGTLWSWRRWLGITVGLLYVSGALLVPPRFYLLEYLQELRHPYETPDQVVAAYLGQNAREGDTVFVSLDRAHEPLLFLLGDKLKFVNRIHPLNGRILGKNRTRLPTYLYLFTDAPDWVVLYGKRGDDGTFLTYDYRGAFPQGLTSAVDLSRNYDEVALPVFFADQSRPELPFHAFRATTPSDDDRVFIYRRKE